jgi:hypothetical protein
MTRERCITYALLAGALAAVLAFTFEVGRFFGHREGIAYAEERAWMVEQAGLVLGEAAESTHACHDIAVYLDKVRSDPKLPRWRLNLAKRALTEPCRNCGGPLRE